MKLELYCNAELSNYQSCTNHCKPAFILILLQIQVLHGQDLDQYTMIYKKTNINTSLQ